mgnify:CR=1 FL=1
MNLRSSGLFKDNQETKIDQRILNEKKATDKLKKTQ